MAATAALVGAMVGAGLMYLADPAAGGRRRALVRDKAVSLGRQAGETQSTTWRDVRNRTQGVWAWTASKVTRDKEEASDELVQERVRAALGPLLRFPRLVDGRADQGRLTLTGAVPADEVQRLVRRLRRVRGVRSIDNRLDVYDDPAMVPGVQPPIAPRPPAPPVVLLRENWPPAVRLAAGTAGVALLLAGMRRGSVAGLLMAVVGSAALLRGLTNDPLTGSRDARPTHQGPGLEQRDQKVSAASLPADY